MTWSMAAGCALGLPGAAAAGVATSASRSVSFYNIHTGESLKAVYWEDGGYLADSLSEIDFVLRDFRTDDVHPIDPQLLDLIHRLRLLMDYRHPVHVISGYRCPETNAMLARRSPQVSKKSFHVKGMAIDIRLPDKRLADVRDTASWLSGGGVGYYPESDFVHMDTGPVRSW